jgi:uncharacterized membrane protein
MATIEKDIVVDAPVREVYAQWTRYSEFPEFMDGMQEVRQLDDSHLTFVASIGGKEHAWDALITEDKPDELVSWRSTDGKMNTGIVRFEPRPDNCTYVKVNMGYEPEGVLEHVGDWVGMADRRVEGDLERFRDLVEQRDTGTDGTLG